MSKKIGLLFAFSLVACSTTRQLAVDFPSLGSDGDRPEKTSVLRRLQPVSGFKLIDGDDYYIRVISTFDFKGDNILKSGCNSMAPSYEKNDLSSTLIFSVKNEVLKLNYDTPGFSYQAGTGKCNYKFDAKKKVLTPWMRLNTGKDTVIDYSFYSSATSDVDVSGLLGDVTAASSLLSFTGVGLGVSIAGQVAGQWAQNQPKIVPINPEASQASAQATPVVVAKNSAESHTLPSLVDYSGPSGALNQTIFTVHAIEEGGLNLWGSATQPIGELKLFPEIISSLLLKSGADGVPDAQDLNFDEITYAPIQSAKGEITLGQLLEQSSHPNKPNLKPKWSDYADVINNCRKIKLLMKELGFNKFDRNALLYYFLNNSSDWKNYNLDRQKTLVDGLSSKLIASYRAKDFAACLNTDDFHVMKAMGLAVNSQSDWEQMGESSLKKEQLFTPLKSIERQLVSVLRNTHADEMERQLYPLLTTAKGGDGTVLLQNHLGDFGLETLLNTFAGSVSTTIAASPLPAPSPVPAPPAASVEQANSVTKPPSPANAVSPIPGEGLIVNAKQLARVFSSLLIHELSCARPAAQLSAGQVGNAGILLFTTQSGSSRAKGGALEFEFSQGKIIRMAFQLSTHRDFEQNLLDYPEVGGCRIDPAFVAKLH